MAKKKTRGSWIILVIILVLLVLAGILIWQWWPSMTGKVINDKNDGWSLTTYKLYEGRLNKIDVEGKKYGVKLIAVNPDNTALVFVDNLEGKLSGNSSVSINGIEINSLEIRFYKVSSRNNFVRFKVKKGEDVSSKNIFTPKTASTGDNDADRIVKDRFFVESTVFMITSQTERGIYMTGAGEWTNKYIGSNWDCIEKTWRSPDAAPTYGEMIHVAYTTTNNADAVSYGDISPEVKGAYCVFILKHPISGQSEFILSTSSNAVGKTLVEMKSVDIEGHIIYKEHVSSGGLERTRYIGSATVDLTNKNKEVQ